jgi:hypothetical protein
MLLPACGRGRKKYLQQVTSLIEQNDEIDAKFAGLPKVNPFADPNFLAKLDSYIASKNQLLNQVESMEAPFLLGTTHAKLVQAMKNGIRYFQSEREKFLIAAEKMSQMPSLDGRDEFKIIQEYQAQTAAYQASMREQMMKQAYERLYYDVKDELERAAKF